MYVYIIITNTWQTHGAFPLGGRGNVFWEYYTHTHTFLYCRKQNLLIHFIMLMFDDTFVFFIHWLPTHGQPAEFHVCVISLHGISLLRFQNCIAIFFLPVHLDNIREKFLKKTNMCSSLMKAYFSSWRMKNSGLGVELWTIASICGENGIAIKNWRHKHCVVWNNLA